MTNITLQELRELVTNSINRHVGMLEAIPHYNMMDKRKFIQTVVDEVNTALGIKPSDRVRLEGSEYGLEVHLVSPAWNVTLLRVTYKTSKTTHRSLPSYMRLAPSVYSYEYRKSMDTKDKTINDVIAFLDQSQTAVEAEENAFITYCKANDLAPSTIETLIGLHTKLCTANRKAKCMNSLKADWDEVSGTYKA